MKPIDDIRAKVEAVQSWANLVHADAEKALRVDDPLNMHLIAHAEEYRTIRSACMDLMLDCTDALGDLDAIDEAHDEMNAANRSNGEREKQFNEDEHER